MVLFEELGHFILDGHANVITLVYWDGCGLLVTNTVENE
jgi:hypothetical protein